MRREQSIPIRWRALIVGEKTADATQGAIVIVPPMISALNDTIGGEVAAGNATYVLPKPSMTPTTWSPPETTNPAVWPAAPRLSLVTATRLPPAVPSAETDRPVRAWLRQPRWRSRRWRCSANVHHVQPQRAGGGFSELPSAKWCGVDRKCSAPVLSRAPGVGDDACDAHRVAAGVEAAGGAIGDGDIAVRREI